MVTLIILFYLLVGVYTGMRRGLTLELVYIAGYFITFFSCDIHLTKDREVLIRVHPISILYSLETLSDFHRSHKRCHSTNHSINWLHSSDYDSRMVSGSILRICC